MILDHIWTRFLGGDLYASIYSNRLTIVRICAIVTSDIILINQYKKAVLLQRWPRECLRRSNQQGVGHFGPKFPGVPHGVDPDVWVCRERASQANYRWNYFRRIPTYVITIHQHYIQTDRQTTCDPKTSLCTKVHRAAKWAMHGTAKRQNSFVKDGTL